MTENPRNRRLSDFKRERIKRMWLDGEKLDVIAAMAGVHPRTISNEVTRQNLPKRTGRERWERQAAE